jgi:hypothetical protein
MNAAGALAMAPYVAHHFENVRTRFRSGASAMSQSVERNLSMCRNIKTLFNFEPPATEDEINASALQFVRKLSGFNKPSQANAAAFELAVDEVSQAARKLLSSLHTHAPARDREIEAEKARERARERFA